MSLMENVSDGYADEDARLVEAIAKTLMSEFYQRSTATPLIDMARTGERRSMHCVSVAGVLVNYLREELE
ncbi:MAG TPA: hypothetical protein VIZ86_16645 [Pseudomonas sp.]